MSFNECTTFMEKQTQLLGSNRNSSPLTKDEYLKLKQLRKRFATEQSCADYLKIGRNALNRILLAGSGKPENINLIRKAISKIKLD